MTSSGVLDYFITSLFWIRSTHNCLLMVIFLLTLKNLRKEYYSFKVIDLSKLYINFVKNSVIKYINYSKVKIDNGKVALLGFPLIRTNYTEMSEMKHSRETLHLLQPNAFHLLRKLSSKYF